MAAQGFRGDTARDAGESKIDRLIGAAGGSATMTQQQTVFILDDDDAVRDSLQILLESAGYATESFPSALDFLKSYDDSRAGCLIADVRMPGMTGLELQEKLRQRGVPLSV